jgi:hypothetical protein
MRKMTKTERMVWNRTHRDYRCRVGGVPYVLELNRETGATELVPLETCRKVREAVGIPTRFQAVGAVSS